MKTITKQCFSLKEVERFQMKLYGQYDSVKLVRAPRFAEEGSYSWEVQTPLEMKQDPLIVAARKAYRSSPRYQLDKLLEEERRWMRKETLARTLNPPVEKTTKGE